MPDDLLRPMLCFYCKGHLSLVLASICVAYLLFQRYVCIQLATIMELCVIEFCTNNTWIWNFLDLSAMLICSWTKKDVPATLIKTEYIMYMVNVSIGFNSDRRGTYELFLTNVVPKQISAGLEILRKFFLVWRTSHFEEHLFDNFFILL